MKSSKSQIQSKFHKIPLLRFEDQKLTSFSGLIIFQILFRQIDLKERLKKCFDHLKVSPIFGRHLVVLLIVIHLLLGFRRLREVDYYRDDPLVLRLLGLRRLPNKFTLREYFEGRLHVQGTLVHKVLRKIGASHFPPIVLVKQARISLRSGNILKVAFTDYPLLWLNHKSLSAIGIFVKIRKFRRWANLDQTVQKGKFFEGSKNIDSRLQVIRFKIES